MKINKLSIGEMADLNNTSVQTLRYYDNIGLLKPVIIDPVSGYRFYDIKQSAILDMIQHMKELGMSLKDIQSCFSSTGDIQSLRKLLYKQKKSVRYKREALENIEFAIDASLDNYTRYLNFPGIGSIQKEVIPERKIFCFDSGENIYNHNLEGYEYILRKLKKQVLLKHLPMVYFCNVGSIIREETLKKGNFHSSEIFLFINSSYNDSEAEIIPDNTFMTIYCDSFSNEKKYAEKLFAYIENNNFMITGDYICEVIVELPLITSIERNMIIKLQVPVKNI